MQRLIHRQSQKNFFFLLKRKIRVAGGGQLASGTSVMANLDCA
jgi:hypothetical protein